VTAGTAATVTVTAKDAYGNTATGYTGTVRITSSDGQAVLPANSTLTNGTGPFTATLKTAGAQSLTATDTVTASITGSASVTVNPAAATHYQLAAPGSATAGSAFTVMLTALDQFNNIATAYQGKAHFTASDAGAGVVLPADYTFVAGDNGVHTFTNGVTLVTAGSPTITATDTVTASITGSASVTVNPDTSPPTAPSNLSAAESGFQINLSWTASTDNSGSVSGYFVERENPGSTTFVQIGTTTGTTYTDTGVAPNSTYSYRVRAEDTSGNLSGYSNVVGVTTPAALTVVGTPTVDANGVVSYSVVSPYLGAQTQTLRVLQPTHPSPGQPPRFLYLLPVLAGLDATYGDGLQTAEQLDLQDQYNATLIAPSFPINPWYADSATDPTLQLESFMVKALVPWVNQTQAATGTTPPNWLVAFSKSGFGALDLILRNPNVFNAAACWDAPVQTTDVNTFSDMLANYGTQQNFANYEIPTLVAQDNAPFQTTNRIWISGDNGAFTSQMVTLDQQMTAAGIKHTFGGGVTRAHNWTSGWLPLAVQGLAPSMANATVLDDSRSQGFTATAGWLNYVGAGYQGNMHYKQSGSGQETAQWTFIGLSAGRYRVSATWVADPNRVANAPYTVLDGSTTLGTVAINQQQQPSSLSDQGGTWQDLGGPYAISSGTLTVKLSDLATAGAYLIADAIRVEYLGAPLNGPQTRVMYNQAALSDGTSQVKFGSTLLGTPVTQTFQVYNDGNANLTLGAITVPAGFSVASGFGATTLAPGASTSFSVSLNASAAGSYSGSVSFATNDSNHPSFTFTVLGTVSTTLVVDDSSSTGFTATAGWLNYVGAGYLGEMDYKQSGSGQETATWTFSGLTPGHYRVSATWVAATNRVANAPYTVLLGSTTLGTFAVDQRQQPSSLNDLGVSWQDLGGPYAISGGVITVKLSDLATAGAYLIADAMRIQNLGNAPPVANNVSAQTVMNTNVNIPVLASCSDPDHDPLTVTAVTQGAHGSVSINANNTVTYTPNSQYTGTDSFTYTIADPCGATATATVTVTIGQAQLAEGGPSSVDGPVPLLTEAELQPVLTEAIREVTHEFNVKQPDQFFGQLDIRLIDHLQSGILGITYGHTIWIDRSAAGHGWYVGMDDGAFGAAVVGRDRFAQPGSAAFGQFDLLTVVTHELAHVVGYASVDASVLPHDLMTKTIAPGVRRISHEDVLFVSMTSTTSPTPIAADMAPAATLPVRPAATEESTFVAMPPAALLADPRTAAIDQVFRDAAAFTMPASVTLLPLLDPAFDPLPFGVSRAELLAADNSSSDSDAILAAGPGDDIVISGEGKDMLVGGTVDIHAQMGLPTWAAFAASEKMEKLIHEEI
jgi:hypothetical protein